MANISLTAAPDYASQADEIQRRQKLADMLAQQSQEAIPINSYNGIQAPIPWTAVLAKALQGGLAGYQAKRASQLEDDMRQNVRDQTEQAYRDYQDPTRGLSSMPTPEATMAQFSPEALTGVAPAGPRPEPMPPSAPNGVPPQAMASALANGAPGQPPPPQAPPPPVAPPQPMPAPQAPPMEPPAPPPQPVDPEIKAQSDLNRALALQRQLATLGQPKGADAYVETARKNLERIQSLKDAAAQKVADKASDHQEAVTGAETLIKYGIVPPQIADTVRGLVAAGGPDALKMVNEKVIQRTLGPHETYLTADQVKAAGYGPGSIVTVNSDTQKPTLVVDGTKVAQENTRIALQRQSVGIAGAHLGLDQAKFAFDKDQKTNAVFDPATVKQMAQQALAGDTSVFTNLGRGAQGAQNIVALRREMYAQGAAAGMSPAQIAAKNAEFFGQKAEARAAGTRVGATDVAVSEVPGLAQEALARHAALAGRGNLVPLNKAVQMVQAGTSSPELAQAVAANQAVINAYARSFGTGITSDHARTEAAAVLQTAWGTPAYTAAVNQIVRNTQLERQGAKAALSAIGSNAPANGPPPLLPHPANIPAGSLWSPSRRQYKTPSGQILDAQGKPVGR